MIPEETPFARVQRLRKEMSRLFSQEQTAVVGKQLMNVSFALNRAQQDWFADEVHGWCQLPITEGLSLKWDRITDWCHDNLQEEDWLIHLPRGEPRCLYFRNSSAAIMIKLIFA